VDAFVAEGITPWLHLDTDWGLNLPHFRKLPRGKCVADLDGTTDIFRAKEILGGHMCISGDVPASLLSLGTPAEVGQYCRRLIDEVGEGGGFMLTTGCECPMDVRPENLRAMVETGKSHRGQKGRTREAAREAAGPGAPVAAVEVRGEIGAALAELRRDEFLRLVDEALDRGKDPLVVLEECRSGMEKVGALYSSGQYFLAELMLSAMVFKTAAERLQPLLLRGQGEHSLGGAVIATPKGDVHDIGKDMVATMLRAAGFQVYDLGVNVPPEAIAEKVAETGARIVAMSALLTTTFDAMKQTVDLLGQRGLREGRYVIIGGGPTTAKVKDHVGADAWTLNPQEGVNLCRAFTAPQP
jgi:methylmalonyl-CoA mutase cobalamin-binding domain/chain